MNTHAFTRMADNGDDSKSGNVCIGEVHCCTRKERELAWAFMLSRPGVHCLFCAPPLLPRMQAVQGRADAVGRCSDASMHASRCTRRGSDDAVVDARRGNDDAATIRCHSVTSHRRKPVSIPVPLSYNPSSRCRRRCGNNPDRSRCRNVAEIVTNQNQGVQRPRKCASM